VNKTLQSRKSKNLILLILGKCLINNLSSFVKMQLKRKSRQDKTSTQLLTQLNTFRGHNFQSQLIALSSCSMTQLDSKHSSWIHYPRHNIQQDNSYKTNIRLMKKFRLNIK